MSDDDHEEEEEDDVETTEAYQREEHQKEYERAQAIASLPKDFHQTSSLDLRKMITSLNCQQRRIFDEMCEGVHVMTVRPSQAKFTWLERQELGKVLW